MIASHDLFPSAGNFRMANFDLFLSEQLRQDVTKSTGRETYIGTRKVDALAGTLYGLLTANLQLEASYYTAPAARAPVVGAPPVPARPAAMMNSIKAIGWAVGNPGAGDVRSVYRQAFDTHSTVGGQFPIRSMEVLNAIWRKLVTGAPAYRSVNIMQPTKYPSSLAGGFIVKNVIADFATTPHPAQGHNRWYDWAL